MVKPQFGKIWSWCNDLKSVSAIEDKHIDMIYRVDSNPCTPGSCKSNCATNPYCLNGLGEKKLINLLQKEPILPLEKSNYLREPNQYAGLINLGATCYINTYLQVWYNNVIFREYILQAPFDKEVSMKNDIDESSEVSEKMPVLNLRTPDSIGKSLQIVFALMKESVRKSIDPNFFIKALGLDENMQQDAQEFSQLFLTTLQSSLDTSNLSDTAFSASSSVSTFTYNLKSKNIINELFQGECSYITEHNCNTILQCMDDLLKPEIMEGDNQYHCSNCDKKQNAKRATKLTDLPPVLNLQLLRFVYDRSSGYKKKISTKIKFNEVLDLNKYKSDGDVVDKDDKAVYHLGAILMHVGKTAYSGHYMAQIKNFQTNEWYNFNDEIITKLKRKSQLGCTDEDSDSKSSQVSEDTPNSTQTSVDLSQTNSSKTFCTANAYLLVYYRTDFLKQTPLVSVMAKLSNQVNIVNRDNQILEKWFTKLRDTRLNENEIQNNEREIINKIYTKLWVNNKDVNLFKLKAGKLNGKTNGGGNTQKSEVIDLTEPLETVSKITAKSLKEKNIPSISFYGKQKPSVSENIEKKEIIIEDQSPKTSESTLMDTSQNKSVYQELYYINTDYLRKLLSLQTNLSQTTDSISTASIQKYLCQHKRLNPLAVNKFKLVRKEGIMLIMDQLQLEPSYFGVLEANNMITTKCRQCIVNCFEYLKCKEKIKSDTKLLRGLMKTEILNDCQTVSIVSDDLYIEEKKNEVSDEVGSGNNDTNTQRDNQENKENNGAKKIYYWIGKESLRLWSSLALKKYESQLPFSKLVDLTDEGLIKEEDTEAPSENLEAKNGSQESKTEVIAEDVAEIECLNEKSNNIEPDSSKTAGKSSTLVLESSSGQENSVTNFLTYFNEDLLCPHKALSPTQNKRLVSSTAWRVFEAYFLQIKSDDMYESFESKVFTDSSRECKICLKHIEENDSKKLEIKNQKDILSKLYLNKSRPNFVTDKDLNNMYYLVPTEFLKTWRMIIKQSKFKNIQITNDSILCPHKKLGFDETSIDSGLATIVTEEEWQVLISSFKFDQAIIIFRMESNSEHLNQKLASQESNTVSLQPDDSKVIETNTTPMKNQFLFEPEICNICMEQNELEKFLFDNKKISIRQMDEETVTPESNSNEKITNVNTNGVDNDLEDTYLASKKARLTTNNKDKLSNENVTKRHKIGFEKSNPLAVSTQAPAMPQLTVSATTSSSTRRSKRSRKCKGDMEIYASSFDTVKNLKVQLYSKLSRMISEQHLFFQGVELENEKTLSDYRIHYTDLLYLKLDPIAASEENEPIDFAHLPEIGFKGTNLISR